MTTEIIYFYKNYSVFTYCAVINDDAQPIDLTIKIPDSKLKKQW